MCVVGFKPRELRLSHVVQGSLHVDGDSMGSRFEQIVTAGRSLKEMLLANGWYTSGPIVYSYDPRHVDDVLVMTTIGNKVTVTGRNTSDIHFVEELQVDTDYYYRHYDSSEPVPFEQLEKKIVDDGKRVIRVYTVILDFYGDIMLDLYFQVGNK
jgi:hypothetical protein